ncbi:DoxX family protein [Segetibacter sp. 3557_3]|uniref:DoxX family protein n=1 Tax=Segetibacter sp. 3557_3 TaxID=2547429 RepID=UPI001058C5B0|nr:DoxX family protein [Segetibacter sp. 3557_3]TDH28905.1 DoxX family protein [Segetibacter sp. 3557_3]
MKRSNKIIYWIATIWLCLGMLSSGIVQLLRLNTEVDFITKLGYPVYFISLIGVWKILGVVALLSSGLLIIKEWAYAGFFFVMSGAIFSHIASGDPLPEILPSMLLLILTVVSWIFRPANRRVLIVNHQSQVYES